MPTDRPPASTRRAAREGKVRKELLDPGLLHEAQEYLGAVPERETVALAPDLATFPKS